MFIIKPFGLCYRSLHFGRVRLKKMFFLFRYEYCVIMLIFRLLCDSINSYSNSIDTRRSV